MTKLYKALLLALALTLCAIISTNGISKSSAEEHSQSTKGRDNVFTPVVVSVINSPNPVLGSDGLYHLVYELEALNATGFPWEIKSVEVTGGQDISKIMAALGGEELKRRTELLSDKSSTTTLPPGETGIIFIHFPVEENAVPDKLAHKISVTVPGGIPGGFKNFAGMAEDAEDYSYVSVTTETGSREARVISPPLEGNGWVAADGCCDSIRHVRALMPINDKLSLTQRFAIDWEMINAQRKIYVGDPKDVESYIAYGKNVLAVADSRVVTAIDKYENQIPGELPPGMTLEEADGNHVVLDLGDGKYALYAHLKPGSVTVKEGDTVKRGQIIGLVGNTGNTSAPHLHFHVMDGPSTLGSNGLPYVIDEFDLIEKAPSTEAFDKAETEGTPLEVVPVKMPGIHRNELPLDQRVVNFRRK